MESICGGIPIHEQEEKNCIPHSRYRGTHRGQHHWRRVQGPWHDPSDLHFVRSAVRLHFCILRQIPYHSEHQHEASPDNWQQLIELSGSEKRIWVDYNDIPQYMEQAVISIEDKRFYTHKGVDWYRSVGAFFNMFLGMRNDFGGSTITQQLIKNLTKQDDVTVQRKLLEIFQALELEKKYDKQDIMQWYLNVVYYGEGSYGVQAAAQTYFGKDIQDLDLAECAAIAGITNLPTYYDPFYSLANNKERQEIILHEMYKQGYITKEECDAAIAEELQFVRC